MRGYVHKSISDSSRKKIYAIKKLVDDEYENFDMSKYKKTFMGVTIKTDIKAMNKDLKFCHVAKFFGIPTLLRKRFCFDLKDLINLLEVDRKPYLDDELCEVLIKTYELYDELLESDNE